MMDKERKRMVRTKQFESLTKWSTPSLAAIEEWGEKNKNKIAIGHKFRTPNVINM